MALGPDGASSIQYILGGASARKWGFTTTVPRPASTQLLDPGDPGGQAGWAGEKYRKLTDPRVYHRHGGFFPMTTQYHRMHFSLVKISAVSSRYHTVSIFIERPPPSWLARYKASKGAIAFIPANQPTNSPPVGVYVRDCLISELPSSPAMMLRLILTAAWTLPPTQMPREDTCRPIPTPCYVPIKYKRACDSWT